MAGIRYAVFWDYENQPGHPAHASQAVADAVNSLGANVCEERRLYSDPHISNVALSRHANDLTCWTQIECPHHKKKEVVDKRIIADMFLFALTARAPGTCVVLISSDGDYAYSLGKLREHGCRIVVLVDHQSSEQLRPVADIVRPFTVERLPDSATRPSKRPHAECAAASATSDGGILATSIQGPVGSAFTGGVFQCVVHLPERFPEQPPMVKMLTKIYHPNIDGQTGSVLLANWSPSVLVEKSIAQVVAELLANPMLGLNSPSEALNPKTAKTFLRDPRKFKQTAAEWVRLYATPSSSKAPC